jgi:hypothetical protein
MDDACFKDVFQEQSNPENLLAEPVVCSRGIIDPSLRIGRKSLA